MHVRTPYPHFMRFNFIFHIFSLSLSLPPYCISNPSRLYHQTQITGTRNPLTASTKGHWCNRNISSNWNGIDLWCKISLEKFSPLYWPDSMVQVTGINYVFLFSIFLLCLCVCVIFMFVIAFDHFCWIGWNVSPRKCQLLRMHCIVYRFL